MTCFFHAGEQVRAANVAITRGLSLAHLFRWVATACCALLGRGSGIAAIEKSIAHLTLVTCHGTPFNDELSSSTNQVGDIHW